jgi:hypothetical protein
MLLRTYTTHALAVIALSLIGLAGAPVEASGMPSSCIVCVSDCDDIVAICYLACGNTTGGLCGHMDECGGDLGIICANETRGERNPD